MSIEALILGKLHQHAEQRTSKTGRPYVTAKVRASAGDGESLFVNVIAFSDTAGAALLALDAGDSLALGGTLKPGAWIDREGTARPSVDMVATQVLTVYGLKKKRDASGQDEAQPRALNSGRSGAGGGHVDDWSAGGADAG